jgi:hypothetical protein
VWEIDIRYLNSLSKYDDKFKYLLCVIDLFSRYAWTVPLKDNRANSIKKALKYLFRYGKPITIQSDKVTELVNATVQQYFKRQRVSFHTTRNQT